MMRLTEGVVKVSVRELVEFVMRSGSIFAAFVSRARAVEGTKAHKKVQEAMQADYEKEVKLVHECEACGIRFSVEGRADGIMRDLIAVTIDEIKSTRTSLDVIDEAYNPLHWAQAKCYAYFYAHEHHLKDMNVRLTYYHLDTKETKHLLKVYTYEALQDFFQGLLEKYATWMRFYREWQQERTTYLKALTFPFDEYRTGQRELAVHVYKSITKCCHLYVNAPTGIGKTISTLFPALKAMGEGHVGKIFYLTAKTITRTVAEKSIKMLLDRGTRVKMVTLTAKDKICFLEARNCHPDFCPYANGHFDRVDEAVYEAMTHTDFFTQAVIEEYAKKYCVCPFEFTLDLAVYADVVIGDYNYMFDPTVALKRFLDQKDFVVLVDEAHNLVDRARDMYSESVSKNQLLSVRSTVRNQYPTIAKALSKLNAYMQSIRQDYMDVAGTMISAQEPTQLYRLLRNFIQECDKKLQKGALHKLPQDLLELYFKACNFNKIYELFDERYRLYADQVGNDIILKLFCMDPSYLIGNSISTCKSVIFFSATLMPIAYYKEMLGGEEAKAIAFPSPFNPDHALKLIATDVSTRYQHREKSYEKICAYISKVSQGKVGNYMVFFPSYKYMNEVYAYFVNHYEGYDVCLQNINMDEASREAFLAQFEKNPVRVKIGFCVLGGIFSEGIDLTEDRLIGVLVVGVGLPQMSLEKDLIKYYFDEQGKEGYHYAYTYPGMNKVLQAVGRLIRTEKDRGVMVLIDDRFQTPLYRRLMPPELRMGQCVQLGQVEAIIKDFWQQKTPLL